MDHTDLQRLHAKSKNVALSKHKSLPPTQMDWGLTQKEDQVLSVQTGLVWKEAKHNAAGSQHFLYRSAKSSYTMLSNKEHSNLSQRDRS